MNELVEKLLKPVSPEQPCGPDLSASPEFDELERIAKGKPEVEMGAVKKPPEPPDWRVLREKSAEYLGKSKHLRVSVLYCCSAVQTAGLAGLRDGLEAIGALVGQHWAAVHPLLDPADNNDPTQRLNILGALTSPRGTVRPDVQQWLGLVDSLYSVPLCKPKGAPPVTLDMIVAARNRAENKPAEAPAEGAPAPAAGFDLAQLSKAFRAVTAEEIQTNHAAVSQAIAAVEGLDQFLTQNLGASGTISFEEITKVLKDIEGILKPYTQGAAEAGGEPGAAAGEGAAAPGAGGIPVSGSVRSREDVVRAIDAICDYYRQVEPSSPVPYLLRRVQKLVTMNFVQAAQELNVSVDTLRPSMGSTVDTDPLAG